MSASQDNLHNQEEIEAREEALLDQSVQSEEDSVDVIVESERMLDSPKFGCDNADLFQDDAQLLQAAETSQDEVPEGPVQSPEVEVIKVIPPSQPMEGIESQQSAPLRDGQDIIGQGDQDNSSSSGEPPLGQGDPKEVESGPHRLEPNEQDIQDYAQESKKEFSFLEIVEAITCHCSNPQASNCYLGVVGEHMLWSWF